MSYGIGCQSVFTDEDERMLDEAAERAENPDTDATMERCFPGAYEQTQAAIEARVDEINRERAERVLQDLRAFSSQEQSPQQKEGAPSPGHPESREELIWRLTEQACALEFKADAVTRAMREAAEELKLGRRGRAELQFSPVYVGAQGVNAQVVKEMTKEVMRLLVKAEQIPLDYRDKRSLDLIVFQAKLLEGMPGLRGQALSFRKGESALPNTIFIYPDEQGRYPKGRELLGVLAHELVHTNRPRFDKTEKEHPEEWAKAFDAQKKAWEEIEKKTGKRLYALHEKDEEGRLTELSPQSYAAWVVAPNSLVPEMREYFDKYHASK